MSRKQTNGLSNKSIQTFYLRHKWLLKLSKNELSGEAHIGKGVRKEKKITNSKWMDSVTSTMGSVLEHLND